MSVWRENPDLMERLTEAQNHPANQNQDITTFCGFFDTRAEMLKHVERCEKRAAEYVSPVRRGRRAQIEQAA